MTQMLDSIPQTFLPLSFFSVNVSILHRLGTPVRCQGLQDGQDTGHAEPQPFHRLVFFKHSQETDNQFCN